MRQRLKVNDGWLHTQDKERARVSGKELIVGGADDHGEAAGGEEVCGRVWGDSGAFSGAVGRMSGGSGALDGCYLALDSAGVRGDGGAGGVGQGVGAGRGGPKHDQIRWAANTTRVRCVDGQLDVGDKLLPRGMGGRYQATSE